MDNVQNLPLLKADDGYYCLSYRTPDTPDAEKLKPLFESYGMLVRFHFEGKVTYIRSKNLEDMKRCISDLGDQYTFKVTLSGKAKPENKAKKTRQQQNKRAVAEPQKHTPTMSQKTENYMLLSNKPARVQHVVIANIPSDCTTADVYDLCAEIAVCPALIHIEETKSNKTPYASVYVKTDEDVQKLCDKYSNFKLKGKKLFVKSANQLLTSKEV